MTRDELIDLMARAHASVFAHDGDTAAAMRAALVAITNAGCAVVPAMSTRAQLLAGQMAWLDDPCRLSSTLYGAMVEAGRIDREAGHE